MLNLIRDLTIPEIVILVLMFVQTTCGAGVLVWMGTRLDVAPHDVQATVKGCHVEVMSKLNRMEGKLKDLRLDVVQ